MSGLSHTENLHGTVYIVASNATSAKTQLGRYLKGSTSYYSVHETPADAENDLARLRRQGPEQHIYTATIDIRRGVTTDQGED